MSSPFAVSRDITDAAAADLKSVTGTERLNQEKLPWLFPPPGRKLTQLVTDAWFKDLSNIKYVEESTGKKFKSKEEAQLSLYSSYPVIFTNTPSHGSLPRPFPRQYLVMIALGSLHSGNGLPTNVNAQELSSGQYVVINGNEVMRFSGKGSGMALFLILDLMEPCSEDGNAGAEK